ncbi:MAG: c-type cytochrome [Bacteroidota bacterium]
MKHVITLSLLAVFVIAASFTFMPNKPWPVPDKDAKKANPVKTDAASVSAGKALWSTHCSSCHGKAGLGDGNKAAQLKTQPEDMSKPLVQTQSDGALFYKVSEGRDDMPSFKKKIPDAEDIWSLVNYMRTLKK